MFDASKQDVASAKRKICATSEPANSTLLTPFTRTVSQILCHGQQDRERGEARRGSHSWPAAS
jgi:hypothetical protein